MTDEQKKTEPLRPWPVGKPGPGETVRPFVREDWIGGRVKCPCHNQLHQIVDAEGPFPGLNPEPDFLHPHNGDVRDFYWIVTLSDGYQARMWEDRKGVLVPKP